MKNLFKSLTGVALFSLAFTMNSCQKEKPVETAKEKGVNQAAVQLLPRVVKMSDDMISLANYVINPANHVYKTNDDFMNLDSTCATITYDTLSSPYRATLDFGSTGCYNSRGQLCTGTIVIEYTNKDPYIAGSHIHIDFQDFATDSTIGNGSVDFDNNGNNSNGDMLVGITCNFSVSFSTNSHVYSGTVTENLEIENGVEIRFTGGLNASANTGETITQTITTPLAQSLVPGCSNFYVKGVLFTQITGESDVELDYGNGACDDLGLETKDGFTKTVALQP